LRRSSPSARAHRSPRIVAIACCAAASRAGSRGNRNPRTPRDDRETPAAQRIARSVCRIGRIAGSIARFRAEPSAVLRRALRFARALCDVAPPRAAASVAYRKKPCRFAMRMHKSA